MLSRSYFSRRRRNIDHEKSGCGNYFRTFGIPNFQTFGLEKAKFGTHGFKSVTRRNLRPAHIQPLTDKSTCFPRYPIFASRIRILDPEMLGRANYFRNFDIPNFQTFGLGKVKFDTPGLRRQKAYIIDHGRYNL